MLQFESALNIKVFAVQLNLLRVVYSCEKLDFMLFIKLFFCVAGKNVSEKPYVNSQYE